MTEMSFPQIRAVSAVSVMEQVGNACPEHSSHLSPRQQLSAGELGGFILQVRSISRAGIRCVLRFQAGIHHHQAPKGAGAPADVQMCPGSGDPLCFRA